MFQKIANILKEPHPGYPSFSGYFKTVAAISLTVFFILGVLRPFGIEEHQNISKNSYLNALIYGLGAGGVMSINALWLVVFPAWFRSWTLGKDFLFLFYQLATIGIVIWFININMGAPADLHYSKAIFITFAIGILPYIIVTFFKHSRYLKNSLLQAELMNKQLAALHKNNLPTNGFSSKREYIIFPGSKPAVSIAANHFLYAESKGNNLHLQWLDKENPKTEVIRCTLNEFAKSNECLASFFRCHRSFVINVDQVQQIKGNAAGYQLVLHPDLSTVSVARSYVEAFKKRLEKTSGILAMEGQLESAN